MNLKDKRVLVIGGGSGTPAEAYLTCMQNTFMTGQVLKIEGGVALAN